MKQSWTEKEVHYLKNNYKQQTVEETSIALNRTISSIWGKARSLGLHRSHLMASEAKDLVDSIEERDIYWIAGILEGEGTFALTSTGPVIVLRMTDEDIVKRFSSLVHAKGVDRRTNGEGNKDIYRCTVGGQKAKALMRRIQPLMGSRRASRIDQLL